MDPVADTETGTTSVEPETSTGIVEGSTSAPATTSTGSTMPIDTTGDPDDTGSSSSDDTAGFIEGPDAGVALTGICVGLSAIGYLGTVHAAGEATIDLACTTEPDPCGGDVVGSWTIASHCGLDALPNFFEEDCPGSTMTFVGSDVQGTTTFEDDASYAIDSTLALDVELELDTMACFGAECEQFGELLEQQADNIAVSCSDAEGSCVCAMTITDDRSSEGTWEIVDDALVLTVDGQASDPIPYCAADSRLALWEVLRESQAYPETPCADAADCEEALGDVEEEWICVE